MSQHVQNLKKFSLLDGFSRAELDALDTILDYQTLQAGEIIFHEHDASDELYFLQRGVLEICKENSIGESQYVVSVLHKGAVCGELAFLDGSPRSAMARTASETELIVLDKIRLKHLPSGIDLLHKLIANITKVSADKLRKSTNDHAQSLQKQLELVKKQNEFGQFLIYILTCYVIGTILNYLLFTHLSWVDVYATIFNWTYLLIMFVPSAFVVWKMKIPLSELGVTRDKWKLALIEGLVAAIGVFILFVAVRLFGKYTGFLTLKEPYPLGFWVFTYVFHSAIQEFLARGLIQTAFQRFFNDENGLKSVCLASILFGLFHVHFGLSAMVVTVVSSLVFGLFYLRHHNLIGVTLLHWSGGTSAFLLGLL